MTRGREVGKKGMGERRIEGREETLPTDIIESTSPPASSNMSRASS